MSLPAPTAPPRFSEAAAGITHRNLSGPRPEEGKRYLLDCIGQGVATADFDGDGRLDVYFPQGRRSVHGEPGDSANRLYRNLGGRRFEPVEDAWGAADEGYGFGALAFDLEGDGDSDLLATNLGSNRLYRNDLLDRDVGGRFTEVGAEHPDAVGTDSAWSTGAAAADVDRDGDLDVYVANYFLHDQPALDAQGLCRFMGCEVPCGPLDMLPQADVFLRNDDGRLIAAGAEAGFAAVEDAFGFQPVFSDIDDDGDLDLYVTNDSMANYLFVNDGRGHFAEHGRQSGVSHGRHGNREAGMGVTIADADSDGLPDIYVTNFSAQVNALYRNMSIDGLVWFQEQAHQASVGQPTFFLLSWGCGWADFDLDGLLDLFVANGHVYPQVDGCPPAQIVYRQANSLFQRQAQGPFQFADVASSAGTPFTTPAAHRGSAIADLDDDGALDLIVVRLDEPPLVAWNDTEGSGHWLMVSVETRADESRPWTLDVGARVVVEHQGRSWSREVRAGSSFLSCEDPRLHFGVGAATTVDGLSVRFSDGSEARFGPLDVDRHVVVRRGVPDVQDVAER